MHKAIPARKIPDTSWEFIDDTINTVKTVLGDGTKMLFQDTVPFAIWCAAHNLHNFEEALWEAVSMLGDRDTICAIVAGIVGMSADSFTVPNLRLNKVENVQNGSWGNSRISSVLTF